MSDQNSYLLFATLTRFGTIIFVIYVAGVLLSLFRYAMRLAAYYESRAHAITIAVQTGELNAQNIANYVAALDGEKLEFGKEPATPIESAGDLLKSAGELVRKAKN